MYRNGLPRGVEDPIVTVPITEHDLTDFQVTSRLQIQEV